MKKNKKLICFIIVLTVFANSIAASASDEMSYGTSMLGLDAYGEYLKKNGTEERVTVAVVDSGVADIDFLKSRLVPGYDFVNDDSDASDDISPDSHGTIIASIIADVTDGLPVDIMPVKILSEKNVDISHLVSGIKFAVDNGADVINLSVGGAVSDCSEIDSAIEYAYQNNVVVVVASGNEKREISDYCPAHNESAITVSAVDVNSKFAKRFSNFGENIDCCAPGVSVAGYSADGTKKTVSGTSFSAAFISAGIAMMCMENPGSLADEVWQIVKSVCVDLGLVGFDNYYGYGLPKFDKLIKTSVYILKYDEFKERIVNYKTTITFRYEAENIPETASVHWFINGVDRGMSETYTEKEAKEDFTVQVKIIADDGSVIAESPTETVKVKNGFIDKIIAFIKGLFGLLPVIEQK